MVPLQPIHNQLWTPLESSGTQVADTQDKRTGVEKENQDRKMRVEKERAASLFTPVAAVPHFHSEASSIAGHWCIEERETLHVVRKPPLPPSSSRFLPSPIFLSSRKVSVQNICAAKETHRSHCMCRGNISWLEFSQVANCCVGGQHSHDIWLGGGRKVEGFVAALFSAPLIFFFAEVRLALWQLCTSLSSNAQSQTANKGGKASPSPLPNSNANQ